MAQLESRNYHAFVLIWLPDRPGLARGRQRST